MSRCKKLGRVIIDELRLCYKAEPDTLLLLQNVQLGERIDFDDFSICRITSTHIKYSFNVIDCSKKVVGHLYFGLHVHDDEKNLIWLKLENSVLYENRIKDVIESVKGAFNLIFNNVTALDLAVDLDFNVTYAIRRRMKQSGITTIINGKAIKDPTDIIKDMFLIYKTTLKRIVDPSIYLMQKKASTNKSKGLHMKSYNKKMEIESQGEKEYILQYYDYPKQLHRLEVHQNRDEIIDFCVKYNIELSEEMLYDYDILSQMFYYHLGSILRFTEGRRKIGWKEILKMQ